MNYEGSTSTAISKDEMSLEQVVNELMIVVGQLYDKVYMATTGVTGERTDEQEISPMDVSRYRLLRNLINEQVIRLRGIYNDLV
jgi:hypothetical protein